MSAAPEVRLLVADDDEDIRALLAFTLRRAGFAVVTASDGINAVQQVDNSTFGLAVLDINMPGADGFAVCTHIRRRSRMPIIMLSARNSDSDIVHALEIGADDYVTKPFSYATLIARVQALLRRSANAEVSKIESDGAVLDLERRTLDIADQSLALTPLEASILQSLFSTPGRLVAMEQIATAAWGRAGPDERHALRQCMHRLRRKLEDAVGSSNHLKTVRGGGYRWVSRDSADLESPTPNPPLVQQV